MDISLVYSLLHASIWMIKEHAATAQRTVAGFAEAIAFADRNPRKVKAGIAKSMRIRDFGLRD